MDEENRQGHGTHVYGCESTDRGTQKCAAVATDMRRTQGMRGHMSALLDQSGRTCTARWMRFRIGDVLLMVFDTALSCNPVTERGEK
jgi:hypothetical protein